MDYYIPLELTSCYLPWLRNCLHDLSSSKFWVIMCWSRPSRLYTCSIMNLNGKPMFQKRASQSFVRDQCRASLTLCRLKLCCSLFWDRRACQPSPLVSECGWPGTFWKQICGFFLARKRLGPVGLKGTSSHLKIKYRVVVHATSDVLLYVLRFRLPYQYKQRNKLPRRFCMWSQY